MWLVLTAFLSARGALLVAADTATSREKMRSAYAAGRLGEAIDASRDLLNELLARFEAEVRASLPPSPTGWTRVGITEAPSTPDEFLSGVFGFGARYADADEHWMELRLVSSSEEAGKGIRSYVEAAPGLDRFHLSGLEGRWRTTEGVAPSQSLVVLLGVFGELHVEVRGAPGVPREALLGLATPLNLHRMSVHATIRRDAMTPWSGDGARFEARMVELDEWSAQGRESLFAIPLRSARAAVAALARLRARRLTDAIRGVPEGWTPDDDPVCRVSATRRSSVYARRYRKDRESLVVAVHLGTTDGDAVAALRPAGVQWEEWTSVLVRGVRGRRRVNPAGNRVEIEMPLPDPPSRVVVFGEGPGAVLASRELVEAIDADPLWRWIQKN